MMKNSRWEYYGMKNTVSHKFQLAERDCVKKVNGKKESNIWDPGKPQAEMRQQNIKLSKKQQNKDWDLGRWRKTMKESCNRAYGQHQQWDQRRVKQFKAHDQEIMKSLTIVV
jgi:hypothetical protein